MCNLRVAKRVAILCYRKINSVGITAHYIPSRNLLRPDRPNIADYGDTVQAKMRLLAAKRLLGDERTSSISSLSRAVHARYVFKHNVPQYGP